MDADREVKPRSLSLGTIFGPYRILQLLGRGGMGIVYEAEEVDSARRVALKVIATPLQNQIERDRFLREGRLAASINHPNCVYVFGACEIDGQPVIALEPMLETLADRLQRDGPLPPAAAVDAILQVAQGLAAAADGGILHRDVKPSNCFIGDHGLVKIGDFGISRSARPAIDTTQLSTVGHVVGTPSYASPEQLHGAPLDTRSDIYSVGATLFELLTGRTPFVGADLMSLLMAVANDPPPAPHTFDRTIPKGLSAVVVRCLAKKPEHRFADYQQLAAALEPYTSTSPTAGTLGRRFVAGTIDLAIVSAPLIALGMGLLLGDTTHPLPLRILDASLAEFVIMLLYFSLFESIWCATPGKALCGLAVVGANGQRASPTLRDGSGGRLRHGAAVDSVYLDTGTLGSRADAGRFIGILDRPGVRIAATRDPVLDRAASQWFRWPARSRHPHARCRAPSESRSNRADHTSRAAAACDRRTSGTLRGAARRRARHG